MTSVWNANTQFIRFGPFSFFIYSTLIPWFKAKEELSGQYFIKLTIRKDDDLIFYALSPNQAQAQREKKKAIYFKKYQRQGLLSRSLSFRVIGSLLQHCVCPSSMAVSALPSPPPCTTSLFLQTCPMPCCCYCSFSLYFFCLSWSFVPPPPRLPTVPDGEGFLVGAAVSLICFMFIILTPESRWVQHLCTALAEKACAKLN